MPVGSSHRPANMLQLVVNGRLSELGEMLTYKSYAPPGSAVYRALCGESSLNTGRAACFGFARHSDGRLARCTIQPTHRCVPKYDASLASRARGAVRPQTYHRSAHSDRPTACMVMHANRTPERPDLPLSGWMAVLSLRRSPLT